LRPEQALSDIINDKSGIIPENDGRKSALTSDVLRLVGLDPHLDNVAYPIGETRTAEGVWE